MFSVTRIYAGQASAFLTDVMHLEMRGPGLELPKDPGMSRGSWRGRGCQWFEVTGRVTDRQLENLFVDGLHPDAERVYAEYLASAAAPAGSTDQGPARPSAAAVRAAARSVQLGARWPIFSGTNPWRTAMYRAYGNHNVALGLAKGAPIPAEVRTALHLQVGREEFVRLHGRTVRDRDELQRFLRTYRRPAQGAVCGYELLFTGCSTGVDDVRSHDLAVTQALIVMEERAAWTRLGGAGRVRFLPVDGLVMAVFPAETTATSIRTRVLLSSKVRTELGRWVALDGGRLYKAIPDVDWTYAHHLQLGGGLVPS